MSPTSPAFAVVLTTVPSELDADALARTLVAEHLVACVNVLPPMQSVYRWEGAVEAATERQLVLKTSADRVEGLRERLHELHPYEVPEFLVLGVEGGSEPYLGWLWRETRRP